jgi:hypothetical protein
MNTTRLVLKKRPMTSAENPVIVWAMSHPEINQYLDVEEQRHKSVEVNSQLVYSEHDFVKGRKKAQEYNYRNCVAITERAPHEWRELGRELGFPRSVTCSAKEVARRVAPEFACARTLADDMVLDGIEENVAFTIGREFVKPFKMIFESGWIPGKGRHIEMHRI